MYYEIEIRKSLVEAKMNRLKEITYENETFLTTKRNTKKKSNRKKKSQSVTFFRLRKAG
ncbi:hypothetical protein ACFSTA_02665 [Ornithinibacillus salinisoli]|uniref:FbpB family small basic protein n=1 Tax=Ornithinibacillus salinisoli TaxID=1848459 RepID=A0ABW4VVL4_9BACI